MRRMLAALADTLGAIGLADPGFRAFERLQALQARNARSDDGLPLPPPYLRVLTAGAADPDAFLDIGRKAADEVAGFAEAHGLALGDADVLEFGCGCGRVARHLLARRPRLQGCDVNPRLVAWCDENLPGRYQVNAAAPPAPFPDRSFDLVYALSVFTHLTDEAARAWLKDLARLVRPGGLAMLTFFDERLPAPDKVRADLQACGYAVRRQGAEGSNLFCGYFTTAGFAERAAPEWRMIDGAPSDRSATGQAWAVFRRL